MAGILVTAIVSVYNSEFFIRGCLDDLLRQSLGDKLEIIVVISGSKQNEALIIAEEYADYSNIKCIKTEREPLYAAWNRAIKIAKGKYLTNANTDDRHKIDGLEIMGGVLDDNPDVGLVYGEQILSETPNVMFEDCTDGRLSGRPAYTDKQFMLSGCHMGSQPMWRTDLHKEIGLFSDKFIIAGDYEFWCRIAAKYPLKYIPEALGLYYINKKGVELSNPSQCIIETIYIKRKYAEIYLEGNHVK